MGEYKILTINPGSTSTKIAVFKNEYLLYEKTLRHSSEEIEKYKKIRMAQAEGARTVEDLRRMTDLVIENEEEAKVLL